MAAGIGFYRKKISGIHKIPFLFYAEVHTINTINVHLFINGKKYLPTNHTNENVNLSISDGELLFDFVGDEYIREYEYPVEYIAIMDSPF